MTTPGSTRAPDPHLATPAGKPRARALGIAFQGTPGTWNSITDVPGVEVGYTTLIEGDSVRTGVTAIHPRGRGNPSDPVAAGFHSQNGNGEMTGASWIEESGTFAGPIAITNTHAVGIAHAGIIAWANQQQPADLWLLPVAAETWDGYLNDINGHHVTEEHVVAALRDARNGPVDEGSVGGGTGMNCYAFKGGSGTSSRLVDYYTTTYTVGVFVQANFGARRELTITGVPMGAHLADDNPMARLLRRAPRCRIGHRGRRHRRPDAAGAVQGPCPPGHPRARPDRDGRRSHSSGDLFVACSTANPGAFAPGEPYGQLSFLPWGKIDPFFTAVVQATEEAVINAMVANDEMTGRAGHRVPALPRDRVARLIANNSDTSPSR